MHVASRLQGDRAGGATKLNKVLFFVEFTHLRRHHQVVSGCQFQKLPHGPAPHQLLPVRRRLIDAGEAKLIEEDFLGRPQQRLVPGREADLTWFTPEELRTIEDVLDQLEGMTGTQVSELSHQEPGWRLMRSARRSRSRRRSSTSRRLRPRRANGCPSRLRSDTGLQPPVDVRGSRRRGRSREDHRGVRSRTERGWTAVGVGLLVGTACCCPHRISGLREPAL